MTLLTIDQAKAIIPTKIYLIGEYINCEKVNIALKQLQIFDISIDAPSFFKLVSNSFISWYQNINKKYVQFNNAKKNFHCKFFLILP